MADNNKIQEQLKEITEKLEQGIKEVFESDKYKEYLNTMSKFYNYSFNNTMLIAMQKPDATLIAGFNAWKDKFDRHVLKGEKGIRIIAPAPIRMKEEVEKIDPDTQEPVLDEKGNPVMEEVEITTPAYKVISVFDVSQTEGKELPDITVEELDGDIRDYDIFMQALTDTAPVPIGYEDISNGAKGYYHLEEKRIAIQEGMSEVQTVKTAIHEIAHATLHDMDKNAPDMESVKKLDRKTKEVEAESIAYTVCQHYGIDTSDYSFGYVAGWSSDKNLKELRSSLETIRKTSATLIHTIDAKVAELTATQEKEHKREPIRPEDVIVRVSASMGSDFEVEKITNMSLEQVRAILEEICTLDENEFDGNVAEYLESKGAEVIPVLYSGGSGSFYPSFQDLEYDFDNNEVYAATDLSPMEQAEFLINRMEYAQDVFSRAERDAIVNAAYQLGDMERVKEIAEEIALEGYGVTYGGISPERRNNLELEYSGEMKLLGAQEDTFGIYQLKSGDELHYHRFESMERLGKHGLSIEKENYELVYTAPLQEGQTLDNIFEQFNLYRPEDFKGHSLSVSDVVLIHKDGENTAHYVDSMGFAPLPDFLKVKEVIALTEAAYEFSDRYLMIHECDEGYDYTFYDKDYKEIDGGVYDDPDVTLEDAVHIILTDDPFPDMRRTVIDYAELEEKVDAANAIVPGLIPEMSLNQLSRTEIEETVLAYAQCKLDEIGADVTLKAAKVYGSRGKGYEKEGSDLDVALSYSGDMREDDLFGLLHEDGFKIADMVVDINPISEEKTGSLEEYLSRANQFLEEQHAKPKQTLTYYVAECMEFNILGEYHENLSFTEAVQIYEMIPAERMNGIKGIGFNIHTEGTDAYEDSTFELMTGKIIDVDTINHIPQFRDNSLVQEAVKAVIAQFPDAVVWDRETKTAEAKQEAQQIANDCEKLAGDIDDFLESYDPYGYGDAVENKEESITEINTCIMNGKTEHITKWLQDVIDEEEPEEDVISATELLNRLDDISVRRDKNPLTKVEELEEGNYDHIDGRLNNQKPQESIMDKLTASKEKTAQQKENPPKEKSEKENEKVR